MTPPALLVADIANNGIVMTGGGSLVDGFDKLITARTGIHTVVAENAISCVGPSCGTGLGGKPEPGGPQFDGQVFDYPVPGPEMNDCLEHPPGAEKCGDTLIIHIERPSTPIPVYILRWSRHSPTPLAMAASGSTGRMTRRTRASGLPSSSTARPGWRPSTGSIPRMSC